MSKKAKAEEEPVVLHEQNAGPFSGMDIEAVKALRQVELERCKLLVRIHRSLWRCTFKHGFHFGRFIFSNDDISILYGIREEIDTSPADGRAECDLADYLINEAEANRYAKLVMGYRLWRSLIALEGRYWHKSASVALHLRKLESKQLALENKQLALFQ